MVIEQLKGKNMKKTRKILAVPILLITVLAVFNFPINAEGSDSGNVIFFEDFDDYPESLFIFNRFTAFYVHDGIGRFWVYDSYRFTYFNANLGNVEQYKFNNMTVRARIVNYQDAAVKKLKGSIGWGLCTHDITSFDYEFVWFIYQQGGPFYPWNGFWVWSRNSSGDFSAKKIEGYNIWDWHVYGINWTESSYDFYIDGEFVAQLTKGLTQNELGIEIWNDNAVWYPKERDWGKIPLLKWCPIISRLTWGLSPVFYKVRAFKRLDIDYVKITE